MRRILRYSLNGLTALSLLLCVTAIVLWVRSYSVGDLYTYGMEALDEREATYLGVCIESGRGTLGLKTITFSGPATDAKAAGFVPPLKARVHFDPVRPPLGTTQRWRLQLPPPPADGWTWAWAGLLISDVRRPSKMGFGALAISGILVDRAWVLPCWMIVLVTGIGPAWVGTRWWRRRGRSVVGHCPVCGYDLRATPERCPECGAVPKGVSI